MIFFDCPCICPVLVLLYFLYLYVMATNQYHVFCRFLVPVSELKLGIVPQAWRSSLDSLRLQLEA